MNDFASSELTGCALICFAISAFTSFFIDLPFLPAPLRSDFLSNRIGGDSVFAIFAR
jgi:hypothetical protein